ncbi:MAG: alpha/beta fold hydrolase [Chlorobiaceae bacterium]|nr:alpha/beta fold hydrolase [Chlorobiaceae bacterium]
MLTYLQAGPEKPGTPTVILLHAFPLSAEMWKPQLYALGKAGYRVIAPNAFGIDGSDEKAEWNFTDFAHELAALMDSLGIAKATITGLSMGGYQAFEFYRNYPEKIVSLVLCDTRAESDTQAAREQRGEFMKAVETAGADEAVRRMVPNYFSSDTYLSKSELPAEVSVIIRRQPAHVINAAQHAIMTRIDSTPLLGSITCPVLVICGTEDRMTTPQTAEDISVRIRGSRLILLGGAGHISNMEQPDAFNRALLEYLRALSQA